MAHYYSCLLFYVFQRKDPHFAEKRDLKGPKTAISDMNTALNVIMLMSVSDDLMMQRDVISAGMLLRYFTKKIWASDSTVLRWKNQV